VAHSTIRAGYSPPSGATTGGSNRFGFAPSPRASAFKSLPQIPAELDLDLTAATAHYDFAGQTSCCHRDVANRYYGKRCLRGPGRRYFLSCAFDETTTDRLPLIRSVLEGRDHTVGIHRHPSVVASVRCDQDAVPRRDQQAASPGRLPCGCRSRLEAWLALAHTLPRAGFLPAPLSLAIAGPAGRGARWRAWHAGPGPSVTAATWVAGPCADPSTRPLGTPDPAESSSARSPSKSEHATRTSTMFRDDEPAPREQAAVPSRARPRSVGSPADSVHPVHHRRAGITRRAGPVSSSAAPGRPLSSRPRSTSNGEPIAP